jgi:nicotinamidase-related amidase
MDGRDRGPQHRARGIHFPPGSKEGQVLAEIAPIADELVLSKTCGSAFKGTTIEYLLRSMARPRVVVVGVVTGSCVQATACDAVAQGFETLVVDDATATWNEEMQQAAIDIMRARGASIVGTNTLLCKD